MGKLSKSEVGRLGGLARQAKYGNLGTPEGRRLGGLKSQITHKRLGTRFKTLKRVSIPSRSVKLAELCGILAGDGHVGKYQVSMTTNSETDVQHARHTQLLFQRLFSVTTNVIKRRGKDAIAIVVSSKRIADFLCAQGLIRGNKVKAQLGAPGWVLSKQELTLAFVRGLFDTDGCVYEDVHRIKGKVYRNIGMAFTNRSKPLLSCFKVTLESLGLHPTQKSRYVVFLRRKSDICRYFEVVGSSNKKHLDKFKAHMKKHGRVPEWSIGLVSKTSIGET